MFYPILYRYSKTEYLDPADEKNFKLGVIFAKINTQNVFKLLYYTFISAVGYYIMYDLDYFPNYLFGNGDLEKSMSKEITDRFFYEKPAYFNEYYLLSFTYHFTDLFFLVFVHESQSDFLMMLVHHICTVILISFSYLGNYGNLGSLILITHDFGDIFVHLCRLFTNTNSNNILKVMSGILLLSVFAYTRLYVLLKLILGFLNNVGTHNLLFSIQWSFLWVLYCLHIIWMYMISKKVYKAISKHIYEDSFNIKKIR